MSKYTEELIRRHAAQEERRIGDIYAECEKRGCDRDFLEAFDGRAWISPVGQAKTFFSLRGNPFATPEELADCMRQFRIFLEVLIEKRPDHEMRKEWEEALQIIKNIEENP